MVLRDRRDDKGCGRSFYSGNWKKEREGQGHSEVEIQTVKGKKSRVVRGSGETLEQVAKVGFKRDL